MLDSNSDLFVTLFTSFRIGEINRFGFTSKSLLNSHLNFDSFFTLFSSVVIGKINYFGFTTVD